MLPPALSIMIVDDDKIDVMALRRCFRALDIENPVVEARSGVEALARLRGTDGLSAMAEPHLVLLDLNMPRMGGLEFLDVVRGDPALQRTLIFVLTTSAAPEDRNRCYDRNIAGYVVKQRDNRASMETVAMLQRYCTMVSFPDVRTRDDVVAPAHGKLN
jgi:CheY-like chemotaxis protein